jgi:hypothetical protein
MERQTYTNTNRYLFLFLIALMVSCSKNDIQIAKSLNKDHLSGLQGCDHPCEHRPAQFLYRR